MVADAARRGGTPPAPGEHGARASGRLLHPDAFFSVATTGHDVVGTALGSQALDGDGDGPPLPGLCHVSAVSVRPDRWGRGVGTRLVRHLMGEARARGYSAFQLWTHADNERAQRLYERLGFVRSGREKVDDFEERIVHYTLGGPAPGRP